MWGSIGATPDNVQGLPLLYVQVLRGPFEVPEIEPGLAITLNTILSLQTNITA